MPSIFRNGGGYKLAIGFAVGGFTGWFVGEEFGSKACLSRRANEASTSSSLQRMMASWTNTYRPIEWDSNWDKRDPKSLINPKKTKSSVVSSQVVNTDNNNNNNSEKEAEENKNKIKPVRHLLLIRHGQYHLKGEDDSKRFLTELGCQQADFTGLRLHELKFPYKLIIHSTMTRARETANIIHKHLEGVPMTECSMLEEGAPFPPEPPLNSWKPDYKFYEDGARIEAAFKKYFHRPGQTQLEDSYEVIVCHANVIRYFVCRALQLPPEAWLRMSLRHGSITWISISSSGRVALRALGDCGYMPADKLSVT